MIMEARRRDKLWKGGIEMELQVILALILAITIIIAPAIFVWYLNIGGAYAAIQGSAREASHSGEKHRNSSRS